MNRKEKIQLIQNYKRHGILIEDAEKAIIIWTCEKGTCFSKELNKTIAGAQMTSFLSNEGKQYSNVVVHNDGPRLANDETEVDVSPCTGPYHIVEHYQ